MRGRSLSFAWQLPVNESSARVGSFGKCFVILIGLTFCHAGHSAGLDRHSSFPRIMGMNIGGPSYDEDSGQQEQFARHDIVILGFYPGWQADGRARPEISGVVRNIKRLNPDIAVGQYTILQESQDAKSHPNRDKAEKLTQEAAAGRQPRPTGSMDRELLSVGYQCLCLDVSRQEWEAI